MTIHLFGGVWTPSAANITMQRVTNDNKGKFSEEAVATVKRNFHVDDCLKSLPTEAAAVALTNELCELLACGGFKLTKFLSNSKNLMKSIPVKDWAKSLKELNLDRDNLPYERALGVLWDVGKDCFTFDVKEDNQATPVTKWGLLSKASSIFDPRGFACPFVLKVKALFQELCRLRVGWDEQVPEEISRQCRNGSTTCHSSLASLY